MVYRLIFHLQVSVSHLAPAGVLAALFLVQLCLWPGKGVEDGPTPTREAEKKYLVPSLNQTLVLKHLVPWPPLSPEPCVLGLQSLLLHLQGDA